MTGPIEPRELSNNALYALAKTLDAMPDNVSLRAILSHIAWQGERLVEAHSELVTERAAHAAALKAERVELLRLVGQLTDLAEAYHSGDPWPPKRSKEEDAALISRARELALAGATNV